MSATSLWTVASAAATIAIAVAACEPAVGDSGVTGADTGDSAGGTDAGVGGRSNAGGATTSGGAAGDGGAAACDPAADHSSDPLNCGACGHDCLGGACEAGACQPVAIWTGGVAPVIFIDDLYVYWIKGLPRSEHQCPAADLVRAPKHSAPLTGEPEVVSTEDGVGSGASFATLVDGRVYYAADHCHIGAVYVRSFPMNSTAPVDVTTVATFPNGSAGIAVTPTTVYALAHHSGGSGIDAVGVALASGAQTVLATSNNLWAGLLTNGSNLIWYDNTTGDIVGMPTSGGTPQTVVPGSLSPSVPLFLDATGLYYSVYGDGVHQLGVGDAGADVTVLRTSDSVYGAAPAGPDVCVADVGALESSVICAPEAGPPDQTGRVLATGATPPEVAALAGDDTAVYWATSGGSHAIDTIYRVAK
jgi:hypothetical protein